MADGDGNGGSGNGAKNGEQDRYTHEEIIADARRVTGEAPRIVRGALATEERKTLTSAQATKCVKSFLEAETPEDRASEVSE